MPDLFDPKMLEMLVCPETQGELRLDRTKNELISPKARLAYPIKGGIPVMIPSAARELAEHEIAREKSTRK